MSVVTKYKTLEERQKAVRSWRYKLFKNCDASDCFYEDRWSDLELAYEDDLESDTAFEAFYEAYLVLLDNPGQHY